MTAPTPRIGAQPRSPARTRARRVTRQQREFVALLTPANTHLRRRERSWLVATLLSAILLALVVVLITQPWTLLRTQTPPQTGFYASASANAIGGGAAPGTPVPASAGGPAPTGTPSTPTPIVPPQPTPTPGGGVSPAPEHPWPPNPWNPTVDHPGIERVANCWAFSGYWAEAGAWCVNFGQCTWLAAERMRDINFRGWGDAWKWLAAQQRSLPTGTVPKVGATVVFQPGVEGAGGAGHVAHVVAVFPGNWFEIVEMNFYWDGGG